MWGAGFAAGMGAGFAAGLVVGALGRDRGWSQLTASEKRTRAIIGSCLLLLAIAVPVGILAAR